MLERRQLRLDDGDLTTLHVARFRPRGVGGREVATVLHIAPGR
jgi:hypothetical protein